MAQQIVIIEQMGDALRNTGYKSIENAISEIIDNSIEADAKDIFVLVSESVDEITHRKYVSEFAFLDNGFGMNIEKLESCLGIGYTTRSARQGIGRFGVGLPQASLHVCPAVDVYSWQNGNENCNKVFLDIDLVRAGEQTQIDDPVKSSIPEKFKKYLRYNTGEKQYDFTKSGTLVHWKKCDRVSPKTIRSLFQRLEFALGQKFRYLIMENTHNIKLIHIENEEFSINVMPNDPMMMMECNYVLGNPDHPEIPLYKTSDENAVPLFEPYTNANCADGVVRIPVEYQDKDTRELKKSVVEIAFSKVKDVFYDKTAFPSKDPGSTDMGKYHVAKMEGISVVRAGREIDFGMFDFYKNINQPQHRWWGCEIRFNPELDEAFGVSNNKQHVELREVKPEDYDEGELKPVWLQLNSVISNTINEIYNKNKETRAKSRTVDDLTTPVSVIINAVEESNDSESETANIKNETPVEELIEKTREVLIEQGVDSVTEEEVIQYMKNKVNLYYKDLRNGPFFDYSFSLGSCQVDINTSHIFYQRFFPHIESSPETKTAFELFIAAFVKTIDETAIGDKKEIADVIVQEWNTKLRKYINEQTNYGK